MPRFKMWSTAVILIWNAMHVWNQQNPSAQLTANFTLAFLTATSNKGHGRLTGGAFFLALEHLNANQRDDDIRLHFNYVFKDTQNMDTMAMRAMVDTHCDKNNVSVFIGPPDFCSNAAVLATSFDIPYMSYGCRDIHSLTRNMSDYLIINEEPSGIYVSKFIVSVLQGFGWKSFWLVGGAEGVTNAWADSTSILNSLATRQGLTLNGINREPLNDAYHSSKTSSHNPYPDIINQSTRKTRVYVFLGDYNALVDFVRALHDRTGSARGEYVVVALDDTKQQRNNKTSFLRIDETNRHVTPHDLEVFRNVLLLRSLKPITEQKDFAKEVYEYNYQDPINLSRPTISAVPKLRQEAFYIYDAVMHYGEAVRQLMKSGQDPYNAQNVVNTLRSTNRKSSQGFDVYINDRGESEGRYTLMSVASDSSGKLLPWMLPVGNFNISRSNGLPAFVLGSRPIAWINGKPSGNHCDGYLDYRGYECDNFATISCWKQVLYSKYAPQLTSSPALVRPLGTVKNRFAEPSPELRPGSRVVGFRHLGKNFGDTEHGRLYLDLQTRLRVPVEHYDFARSSSTTDWGLEDVRCRRCPNEGPARVQDMKNKLRLVVARRELDWGGSAQQALRKRVVHLPMLQIDVQHSAEDSPDTALLRDARQSLRHMLGKASAQSQTSDPEKHRASNCSQQVSSQQVFTQDRMKIHALNSADPPRKDGTESGCGNPDDREETETVSSFDADRVDSALFDYVFDRLSHLSDDSSQADAESDVNTLPVRPRRPCTTKTVWRPRQSMQMPPVYPLVSLDRTAHGWNAWLTQEPGGDVQQRHLGKTGEGCGNIKSSAASQQRLGLQQKEGKVVSSSYAHKVRELWNGTPGVESGQPLRRSALGTAAKGRRVSCSSVSTIHMRYTQRSCLRPA